MFERAYRQRLDADLARWQADGLITPAAVGSIRSALPPLAPGINIPVVVAIVGGLLIAAAFLAFVAAHWTDIARPLRFAMLAAGIIIAHGLAGWFARAERTVLADLCASVGAIIFGAGIALVGQMYHLGEDFAGGMLLWASGALAAAALTGSRGALAVALTAASIWSVMRVNGAHEIPHLPFVAFWLIAAGLAFAWNSRVAAHLVAVAALPWWIALALVPYGFEHAVLGDGAALLLGGGLALAAAPWRGARSVGAALSAYGAFALAGVAVLQVVLSGVVDDHAGATGQPLWANACGVAGAIAAFATVAVTRRAGPAFAGAAIALVLFAAAIPWPPDVREPWLADAAELAAMLCLVVSGMLDRVQSRIVAGWIGIAGVIAGITWAVKGSLLRRSAFLAAAGLVAVALAFALNRLLPGSDE
jgi:Predicted membrane protein (DUF2157)